MPRVKVGPKYQVVIPRVVRRTIGIHPGDFVTIESTPKRQAIIKPSVKDFLDKYQGILAGAWDEFGGSEAYLEQERNSWDDPDEA